jgi:putative ABC transport system permease protein
MSPAASRPGRVYSWLSRVYPAAFRARFGDGMRDCLARDLADTRRRGRGAVIRFWALTVADLLRFGLAERFHKTSAHVPAAAPEGVPVMNMKSLLTTDLRDGWRSLRATPIVTAVAVLSLALGIGANTALFSILNGLLLKSLPVHEPARLALLEKGDWTNPIWEEIRSREQEIGESAFAWSGERFDLAETGETDVVEGEYVSGRLFDVLGISAVRGRMIGPADDVRGGGPDGAVAVVSYALWQRRFGGADDVVGRRITVERVPFTIVGVAPEGFFGPEVGRTMDVAIPIGTEPLVRGKETFLDRRSTWWLNIMVRLRPDESVEQATGRLRGVQPQIRAATLPANWPAAEQGHYLSEPLTLASASTGQSWLRQRYVRPLTVILIVVGLVLLIACANIASLLLARAVSRRHEFSVRLALGASRSRIARQLLAESVMMAAGGALLGLAFAHWASRILVSQLTALSSQVTLDLSLDWRVLAFTSAVTGATVMLFGLAPAFGVSSVAPQDALKEQGRGVAGDRRMTLRHALVVMQVALSLTLVVGALLFARTFTALVTREAGFDREPILIVNVNAQRISVPAERRPELFEQLRQAAASVPGVASAAASFTSPVATSGWNMGVAVPPGSPLGRRERMTWVNAVSPGWFRTYGMPLATGRDVSHSDSPGGPHVAVVNRSFAKRFLEPGNPIGQQFKQGEPFAGTAYEVIGLVEDAVYRSLRAEMMPIIYIPIAQWDRPSPDVVLSIRSAGAPPLALARSVTAALTASDGRLAVSSHSLSAQVGAALVQERLLANMSVFFGGLALLLAGLGLYGVTSYAVNSRRTEIGIRMALGANPAGVIRLVLRRVGWLVATGVVAGMGLSLWVTQFVSTLLYGLQPRDPITLVAAACLLTVVGTLAGWVPARRAANTDPTIVLREG